MKKQIEVPRCFPVVQHSKEFFSGTNSLQAFEKYKELGIADVVSVYPANLISTEVKKFCKQNKIRIIYPATEIAFVPSLARVAFNIARQNRKVAVCCDFGCLSGTDVAEQYLKIKRASIRRKRLRLAANQQQFPRVMPRRKK